MIRPTQTADRIVVSGSASGLFGACKDHVLWTVRVFRRGLYTGMKIIVRSEAPKSRREACALARDWCRKYGVECYTFELSEVRKVRL